MDSHRNFQLKKNSRDPMIILWHQRDLRLEDHPALTYASGRGCSLLPLYIHEGKQGGEWSEGAASRWWLHHSLASLKERYQSSHSDLILRQGSALTVFTELLSTYAIEEVCWIRRYEPHLQRRDKAVQEWLTAQGILVTITEGNQLVPVEIMKNGSGKPYVVFTPFWRALSSKINHEPPLPKPKFFSTSLPQSVELESLELLPTIPWYRSMEAIWSPGRKGALDRLNFFCDRLLGDYKEGRDVLAAESTSCLSPHLAFGELSPKELFHHSVGIEGGGIFLRQLAWREFANSFLYHFPNTVDNPWREQFAAFPWNRDDRALSSWKRGKTGYPIVDAAMRQLWTTGWMHNRARMIVASFLVKDLRIHWMEGARWFWDTLVDADLANNTLGWQWVSGSGADAAPYFRIFNPTLQGKKFDEEGHYVRKYLPELKGLPNRWIHEPWAAPSSILTQANITLGGNYPLRIVDHDQARKRALEGYAQIRVKE